MELEEGRECARRGVGKREALNEVWKKGRQERGICVVDSVPGGDCDDIACLELVVRYGACAYHGVNVGHKVMILIVLDE